MDDTRVPTYAEAERGVTEAIAVNLTLALRGLESQNRMEFAVPLILSASRMIKATQKLFDDVQGFAGTCGEAAWEE